MTNIVIINNKEMDSVYADGYKRMMEALERSHETARRQKAERIEKYNEDPTLCEYCGDPLPYEKRHNKFCSQSCSATLLNYKNGKRVLSKKNEGKRKKFVRLCVFCGEELTERDQRANKFCDKECELKYKKQQRAKRIEGGEKASPVLLRNYLMEKYECKCQLCGWGIPNPVSGKISLDLHHVDGDSSNNVLDNVQLLCPNCHALTPNYKSMNKGSKRTFRNKNNKE